MNREINSLEDYWAWLKEMDEKRWFHIVNGGPGLENDFVMVAKTVLEDPRIQEHQAGDWSSQLDVATGAYEVIRKVKVGDVVLDVGAHIGHFVRSVMDRASLVVAFEPLPRNFLLLRELAADSWNVATFWTALWSSNVGSLPFYGNESSSEGSLKGVTNPKSVVNVPTVALDALHFDRIDFLKIDVERAEVEVLRGAKETIKRCRPFIAVEVEGTQKGVLEILTDLDYFVVATQYRLTDSPNRASDRCKSNGLWHCQPREEEK